VEVRVPVRLQQIATRPDGSPVIIETALHTPYRWGERRTQTPHLGVRQTVWMVHEFVPIG
jgi:hypothetical protein